MVHRVRFRKPIIVVAVQIRRFNSCLLLLVLLLPVALLVALPAFAVVLGVVRYIGCHGDVGRRGCLQAGVQVWAFTMPAGGINRPER